ncbi:MAG: D-3-phosphoglycerate dehydrogenase [Mariniblastus sp.]|jgi:D-3-phosphoglycerate dehydrogenase
MTRVLLTTTSYQDTPGPHHELLASAEVEVHRERGPLPESKMLELAGEFDAFLCGDDVISRAVLEKARPRLKIISKYGIGVDKIDVAGCTELGIPLTFCPGVNHTTVAEHTFGLMLAVFRHMLEQATAVRAGNWKRMTGHEIMGKTIGVIGLGRIGKEVVKRAKAFEMNVVGLDLYWPAEFAEQYGVQKFESFAEVFEACDVVSLHTNLTDETRDMIRTETIATMKKDVVIVNCARGELVNSADMAAALAAGNVGGYATDVLDEEPPSADHPLLTAPNCLITPHIGSRTFESVERQAMMATENLIRCLKGEQPLAQVNDVAIPAASI